MSTLSWMASVKKSTILGNTKAANNLRTSSTGLFPILIKLKKLYYYYSVLCQCSLELQFYSTLSWLSSTLLNELEHVTIEWRMVSVIESELEMN